MIKKPLFLFLICLLIPKSILAQNDIPNPSFYQPQSKYQYLLGSTAVLLGLAGIAFGGLLLLPESVTNWSDEDIANIKNNYVKKVNQGPVIDRDELWLNIIAHPYSGAVYYMQPRTAGFSWAESAFFSFLFSTFFWEFGIEAIAEIPSWQDLIITPAIGSLLGEGFFRISRYIQHNDGKFLQSKTLGMLLLFTIDPIGFVMRDLGLAKAMGIKDQHIITSFMPSHHHNKGFMAMLKITW